MTVEQFEKVLDYLLEIVREFGPEGANTDAMLLDALEARCDYLRGEIMKKTRAQGALPTYQEMRGVLKGDD